MSDLVNLSNCVMDSNPAGNGWARRLRRKAFVGSLALEAALVGAMLLWPLVSPAVLPMQAAVTPVPPYYAQRPPTPVVTDSAEKHASDNRHYTDSGASDGRTVGRARLAR